jgi:hypothetical protein
MAETPPPPLPEAEQTEVVNPRRKRNLTSDEIKQVIAALMVGCSWKADQQPLLRRGIFKEVGLRFGLSKCQLHRIWKRAKTNFEDPNVKAFRASPKKKGNSGRPRVYDTDKLCAAIAAVPLHQKRSLRKLAAALDMPLSSLATVAKRAKEEDDPIIRPHSSAIKPLLSELHEVARMMFACSRLNTTDGLFNDCLQEVHVDEKWCFLTEAQMHFWLSPEEPKPHRSTHHKCHIIKVMFLTAVARPRFNAAGQCTFDSKIGMWPFAELQPAKRNSVNRPRGTMEWKQLSVTKERYRDMLIDKVIPAIKQKWPDCNRNIKIQQDGASSHIGKDNDEFMEAATAGNWNIELLFQSAQSPDTNINDLAFFRALQSTKFDLGFATDTSSLIVQVLAAFDRFDHIALDNAFLTLQLCMEGGNKYDIPHVGKGAMRKEDGKIPLRWTAATETLAMAREFLNEGP